MRRAARVPVSGPRRPGGRAWRLAPLSLLALLLGLSAPAAEAQLAPPPSRPRASVPADPPPPATAYADAIPEAARARDAGETERGAWPPPPPRRPEATEAVAQPQLTALDRTLDPAELPAPTLAPGGPPPPPARGLSPALVSTLAEAIAGAPGTAPAATRPGSATPDTAATREDGSAEAGAPDAGPRTATAVSPQADAPAEPLPQASLAADPSSARAAAVSAPPPARPSVAARAPQQAAAPRERLRPTRGAEPAPSAGGLCGDPRLSGRVQAPIDGPGRCGIEAPVEVTHALGVVLAPPAVINCRTARIFADWLEAGPMREAPRRLGARIAKIRVAASYACRPRNNRPGARLSEHGLGNAVDVRAFQLSDGREIGPLRSWGKGEAGAFLKAAWTSACGPFGTVLGPGSDEHHQDHLHFDSARRSQAYCR